MQICILALELGFHAITLEQYSYEIRQILNKVSVALNLLVLLFCCLVARSGRKRGDRRTDTHANQVP